jgi:hypothetical protein
MTTETIADMVWALGQCIEVDIFDPFDRPSNAPRVVSEHAQQRDGTAIGATALTPANKIAYAPQPQYISDPCWKRSRV